MKSKVLVTGANGFLGSCLVPRLISDGYDVRILVRETSDLSLLNTENLELVYGDVTDLNSLTEAAKDCEAIFHLAGVIAYVPDKLSLMKEVNVGGTTNVLKVCAQLNIKKLLYLSSVVAIGASFKPEPLNEESEFAINHLDLGYFDTKREAEQLVVDAVTETGLHAIIVNPSTVYGRGDALKGSRETQLKVAQGKFPIYPEGGVNVVWVGDVIDGIMLAFDKGIPGRRYVLSGDNITIKDLFNKISCEAGVAAPKFMLKKSLVQKIGLVGDLAKFVGVSFPINSQNAVTSSLYHWFDNSRAKKELGFNPKPAQFAIHESVQWMKDKELI